MIILKMVSIQQEKGRNYQYIQNHEGVVKQQQHTRQKRDMNNI